MNYLNYINHSIYSPSEYFRRFDFDLDWCEGKVKRIGLASLPFLGMIRPIGITFSVLTNGSRAISHLKRAIEEEERENWKQTAIEVGKMSLALLALSVSCFYFTTGLLITTGVDVVEGGYHTVEAISEGEYQKAAEEALQTVSSSLYLAFIGTGVLEVMVCFGILQAVSSLYQARGEIREGHYIEAAAKVAMSVFRIRSVHQSIGSIQRRNALLKMERTAKLFARVARGRQASHLIRHPLACLKERIQSNDLIFRGDDGEEIHLGAHFHGNGGALVKGENLAFHQRVVDGKEVIEIEFKINHAFRDQLDKSIAELKKIRPKEMREIFELSGSHATGISFHSTSLVEGDPFLSYFHFGEADEIVVHGLGVIRIGSVSNQPNLYDKVVIQMDENHTLYDLHEMLALLELDGALCLSTPEEIERLKMGQLFRTFFPREALSFERSEEFFTLSLVDLKAKMIEKAPGMEGYFETYYHRMKPQSILGGRVRYRIEGLAEAAYQEGARALTSAITGAYTKEELFERVAMVLQMGLLSTETRDDSEMHQSGLGGWFDYLTGGADSVYTQLLTQNACAEKMNLNQLYDSQVRFLISLDVLELGSYQYHGDCFGNRLLEEGELFSFGRLYAERDNILEFIRKEQERFDRRNEVMLKERIDSSFFKGLIVRDAKTKSELIEYLRTKNLVENDSILNIPVDQFIRVGTELSEELIA